MHGFQLLSALIILLTLNELTASQDANFSEVSIAVLIRHKTDYVPYLLGSLDRLTYPKQKIRLWIRILHDDNKTRDQVEEWIRNVRNFYSSVDFKVDPNPHAETDEDADGLSFSSHQISVTQQGVNAAKINHSEFVLVIQDGMYLCYDSLIEHLIYKFSEHRAMVIAPMMEVPGKLYSNYWSEIAPTGDYQRAEEYNLIVQRKRVGVFPVKVIHSVWMLSLHGSGYRLDFTKPIPEGVYTQSVEADLPLQLAYWAEQLDGRLMISNMELFGYMTLPPDWYEEFADLVSAKNDILTKVTFNQGYQVSEFLKPEQSKLSAFFDKVYVINLKRRPFKRTSSINMLFEFGFTNAEIVDAVDGKQLTEEEIERDGIKVLSGYEDPYRGGSMKLGEIACFLSHYNIWKKALEDGHDKVLILEDDFSPTKDILHGRTSWEKAVRDINSLNGDWDLLYLGRRFMGRATVDVAIPNLPNIVYAGYSHWAVAYGLTARGLRKLIDSEPLVKLVPSDDLLPILSDVHDRRDWSSAYPTRDLVSISVKDLIIEPRHFPDDLQFYVSDTEGRGLKDNLHDEL